MTYKEIEIPADVIDEARELRGELLEAVAEFDDTLWRNISKMKIL